MWDMNYMIVPVIIGENGIVKKFKDKFGSLITKTFNRFTTNDSCTRNITHNMESTAI
jgi:hypothetical protein